MAHIMDVSKLVVPPIEELYVDKSGYDGSGRAPHGFYHIYKCWDRNAGDMSPVAYLSINFVGMELVKELAQKLGQKFNVPVTIGEGVE